MSIENHIRYEDRKELSPLTIEIIERTSKFDLIVHLKDGITLTETYEGGNSHKRIISLIKDVRQKGYKIDNISRKKSLI